MVFYALLVSNNSIDNIISADVTAMQKQLYYPKEAEVDDASGGEIVTMRQIHNGHTKRSLALLPQELNVEFKVEGRRVELRLKRNVEARVNVPITYAEEAEEQTREKRGSRANEGEEEEEEQEPMVRP